jgi:hypothetical protein
VTTHSLDAVVSFLAEHSDLPLSGALARDLVTIIVDNAHMDGREPVLSVEAAALAYLQFTGSKPRNFEMPEQSEPRRAPAAVPPPPVQELLEDPQPPEEPSLPPSPSPAPAEPRAEEPRDPTLAELAARLTGSANGEDAG